MDVSGSIEHDELMTALRLVSRGRGTGVLTASTAYANASIGFEGGEILFANATSLPKFGEMLVEKGLVSREQLDAALWIQRQDKQWRALGLVILDVKLQSLAVLEAAIEEQITRVLDEVLRWDRGTFRFDERPPAKGALILPQCRDLGQYEVKVALLRQDAPVACDGAPA